MSEHEPTNHDPFKEGIRHAESGYKNGQDIIKFIDTKAGVIAGFAFVGLGVILQGIKEFLGFSKDIQNFIFANFLEHSICAVVILITSMLSSFCGICCVWLVVRCVTARPRRIASKAKHTILFPYWNEDAEYGFAREHYEKLERGLTHKEIAIEYGDQLLNVGAILHKKIKYQRWAAHAFLIQFTLLALIGAIVSSCVFQIIKTEAEKMKPQVTQVISNTHAQQLPHVPNSPIPSSTP